MNSKKNITLTGDRPTGKLHLGHYVGSLMNRVELQNSGKFDEIFIMIADTQALTDNARNPEKVRKNILQVALDYLSVGIGDVSVEDFKNLSAKDVFAKMKGTIFIQSQIPALSELTMYYMNLVSLNRVLRNPTVKTEIEQKQFSEGVPAGFAMYPVSQAADITAFDANIVPAGEDQEPMLEITRDIVNSFNNTYGQNVLIEPFAKIPEEKFARRLPGIDGNAKMSKSLGNGIYLSDDEKTLREKVFSMFTDPGHIHVEDPGKIKGNMVFTYLDIFARKPEEIAKVAEMKQQYQAGGLGDVATKKFLFEVLNNLLKPIRERREMFSQNPEKVMEILEIGSEKANVKANITLLRVKSAIGINYFKEK